MAAAAQPVVRLTFDDGPDPSGTDRILAVLDRHGGRATFFPIATRASDQPAVIERILAAGHVIGLHCDTHVRHTDRSRSGVERDTELGLDRLAALGVTPRHWRTPWGIHADFTAAIAADHGLELVGWDLDTHDWRGDAAGEMFAATRPGLRPGAIVLAHDGIGPGARRIDVAETAGYVELVAVWAEDRGLALEAIE